MTFILIEGTLTTESITDHPGLAMLEINKPDVLAEVTAAFERYENALVTNDLAVLDELFWDSEHTLRYGIAENLYSFNEISAYRSERPPVPLTRDLVRTRITTYGDSMATANTMFKREINPDKLGRQSQTWMKTEAGWRVVSAHVSLIDYPDTAP